MYFVICCIPCTLFGHAFLGSVLHAMESTCCVMYAYMSSLWLTLKYIIGSCVILCMVSTGMDPLMFHVWSLLVWNHWCYTMDMVSAITEPMELCYVCGLHWYGAIVSMLCMWSPLVWNHWCYVMCVVSSGMEPLVLCFVMLCELFMMYM